ncbi:MAG: biopolymer transporter ExbD [Verrucomicrobiota bacterium]
MKLKRSFQVRLDLFAIIPLVNVLFLALMLFTLSSRFTLQPGLHVTLPTSASTLAPIVNPLVITITAAPAPTVYLGEEKVSPEKLDLILKDRQLAGRRIIIRADANTPYDRISQISNIALQRKFPVSLAFASEATP